MLVKILLAIVVTTTLAAAYVSSGLGTGTRDNLMAPVEFIEIFKAKQLTQGKN